MARTFRLCSEWSSLWVAAAVVAEMAGAAACGGGGSDQGSTIDAGTDSTDDDGNADPVDAGAEPPDGGVVVDGSIDPPEGTSGEFAWARLIPGADDQVAVAVGPDGSIYVAAAHVGPIAVGSIDLEGPRGDAIVVLKLDADARPIWARSFGGADRVYVQDIAVTSDGGAVVGGVFVGEGFDLGFGPVPASSLEDGFLLRLDGDGRPEWARSFATTGSGDHVAAIEAADDGSFYVYGYVSEDVVVAGDAFEAGGFLARYDADGTRRWARALGSVWPSWQGPMALDPEQRPVIAGTFCCALALGDRVLTVDPDDPGTDIVVAGFDGRGEVRFARQIVTQNRAQPTGLAFAPGGDIYLELDSAGGQVIADDHTFWDTVDGGAHLLRLSPDGTYRWSSTVRGGLGNRSSLIAVDRLGAVYTIAPCGSTDAVDLPFACDTAADDVIRSYGPDDQYRWATYVDPTWIEAITPALDGRMIVAGATGQGIVRVDFGGLTVEGDGGLFVAALVPGVVVDESPPPPAPTIETVSLEEASDREIRQGGTGILVVTGSQFGQVGAARLGGIPLEVVARSPERLRLAVTIPHGQAPGSLPLTLRNAGGTAQMTGAVEVTRVIVTPSGRDTGRGTTASPLGLCRSDWPETIDRGDTLELRRGTYSCPRSISIPRGAILRGEGTATTTVQFPGSSGGFSVYWTFYGNTEFRDLTIEQETSYAISVWSGHLSMVDVAVRGDAAGVSIASAGTASLTRYRYAGESAGLVSLRAAVTADTIDVDAGSYGVVFANGNVLIANSTIRSAGQCAVQAASEDAAPMVGARRLTILDSSIRSGACGVATYGADLIVRESDIETTEEFAVPSVQVFGGTAEVTGSTLTSAASSTGLTLWPRSFLDGDGRGPTAILDDVDIVAGLGIGYATGTASGRLTMRRTRVRATTAAALTLSGPFDAVDLGTPDPPAHTAPDRESGPARLDPRTAVGAPIDAGGIRLNGISFAGNVTGPIEVPSAYRIDGPNIIRF